MNINICNHSSTANVVTYRNVKRIQISTKQVTLHTVYVYMYIQEYHHLKLLLHGVYIINNWIVVDRPILL
jgi:hypothetical protein